MNTKITINGIPAELKAYEARHGWRCEVVWMLQWAIGASVLGRGDDAEKALADFRERAKADGHEIADR